MTVTRCIILVFFSKVLNEHKLIHAKITVVAVDRNFGLLGRDVMKSVKKSVDRCFRTAKTDKLPAVEGISGSIKLKQYGTLMFCGSTKDLLPLELRVDQTIDKLLPWEGSQWRWNLFCCMDKK